MKTYTYGLILLAAVLFVASPALADPFEIQAVGDGAEIYSWSQRFAITTFIEPFDLVALRMVTAGDTFEKPAMSDFSTPTWMLLNENDGGLPTLAAAGGQATRMLGFDVLFPGKKRDRNTFEFEVAVFDKGDDLGSSKKVTFNGWWFNDLWLFEWQFCDDGWAPSRAEVGAGIVPVPAAVILGAIGIGLAGWVGKRTSRS